jgi:hypothetical protein
MFILTLPAAALSAGPDTSPSDPIVLSHPLHFDVNLVQVDAVVTDSHGQRVSGLRAERLRGFQDRKRRQITHFLYVPGAEPVAWQSSPMPRQLTHSEARRVFLIYVDDRTMSFAAMWISRAITGDARWRTWTSRQGSDTSTAEEIPRHRWIHAPHL